MPLLVASTLAAADPVPPVRLGKVEVRDRAPWRAKLDYLQPEIDGPLITVTKKTSITRLDHLPPAIEAPLRGLFSQTPGLYLAEQQAPGQTNLSYRGIGNPQESEFVTVLQDGIPLEGDWIGFPTLYVFPLPQTLEQVQLVRGGSALLYGPEPPPVVNLVSRRPVADRAFAGTSENVLGSRGLHATFDRISGTAGEWDYLADAHLRRSEGERANGDSLLRGADLHFGYRPDTQAYWAADFHAYDLDTGDAGKLGDPVWRARPRTTSTPDNRLWTERYVLTLRHERGLDERTQLFAKAWAGYQDQASRSEAAYLAPAPPPASTTLQDEQFRFSGLDVRVLHRWAHGNALSVGATLYRSEAPFRQWTTADLRIARNARFGSACAGAADKDCLRLSQQRSTAYGALFGENVFRWGRWHLVPSLRLEHERVRIDEAVKPPTLSRDAVDRRVTHDVPLLGLGAGNDFGHLNESYVNVSQGWRPVRYFDIGSPFGNTAAGEVNDPDPTKVLSIEAGVHGTPRTGLFYDASLFQVKVRDRIESQPAGTGAPPNNTINVNTGDTRHRGIEGQLAYDFLAARDASGARHFSLFANLSLLDARFTASRNPALVGQRPAFAPRYLARAGLSYREDRRASLALSLLAVASQYFADNHQPANPGDPLRFVPARIPAYRVLDLNGEWWAGRHMRLLGGIANLTDRRYYSRVFQNAIEPAPGRSIYAGAAYEF